MKSLRNLSAQLAGETLLADDVLEFHAIRLLLLMKLCGTAGRIEGLTKMAKLDFFVRYPEFFRKVATHLGRTTLNVPDDPKQIESSMVRYHYGPWDKRYYHILSYLESKNLITVGRVNSMFVLRLTGIGMSIAGQAQKQEPFRPIVDHMRQVKILLGNKAGSTLKELVYQVFDQEVGERKLGEVIA